MRPTLFSPFGSLLPLLLLSSCGNEGDAPGDGAASGGTVSTATGGTAAGGSVSTATGGSGTGSTPGGGSGAGPTNGVGGFSPSGGRSPVGQGGATGGSTGQGGASGGSGAGTASGGTTSTGGVGGAPTVGGGSATGGSSGSPEASTGCGMDPLTTDTTIKVGSGEATYILDLPTAYDKTKAYPLVFSFHGAGVAIDRFRGFMRLQPATAAEAILVTPSCVNTASAWDTTRDLPMFDALLTHLEATYCVDQKRVFASGHSSGGFFTHAVGCARASKLRGIAAASAGPPAGSCQGELAVWISQGDKDPTVAPARGRAAGEFWAKRSSCDPAMSAPVEPAPCVEYAGCDAGFPVRYCEYDGEHNMPAWVGGAMWNFFKAL